MLSAADAPQGATGGARPYGASCTEVAERQRQPEDGA
jgi:hypothetical protein